MSSGRSTLTGPVAGVAVMACARQTTPLRLVDPRAAAMCTLPARCGGGCRPGANRFAVPVAKPEPGPLRPGHLDRRGRATVPSHGRAPAVLSLPLAGRVTPATSLLNLARCVGLTPATGHLSEGTLL